MAQVSGQPHPHHHHVIKSLHVSPENDVTKEKTEALIRGKTRESIREETKEKRQRCDIQQKILIRCNEDEKESHHNTTRGSTRKETKNRRRKKNQALSRRDKP